MRHVRLSTLEIFHRSHIPNHKAHNASRSWYRKFEIIYNSHEFICWLFENLPFQWRSSLKQNIKIWTHTATPWCTTPILYSQPNDPHKRISLEYLGKILLLKRHNLVNVCGPAALGMGQSGVLSLHAGFSFQPPAVPSLNLHGSHLCHWHLHLHLHLDIHHHNHGCHRHYRHHHPWLDCPWIRGKLKLDGTSWDLHIWI